MEGLGWQEWAAVAVVGTAIGAGVTWGTELRAESLAPASIALPVALMAGSYVAGYAARQARPAEGYPMLTALGPK